MAVQLTHLLQQCDEEIWVKTTEDLKTKRRFHYLQSVTKKANIRFAWSTFAVQVVNFCLSVLY